MTVEQWLGTDNNLGIDIWNNKYRFNNESFDDWLDRVSGGDEKLRKLIVEKKFLFGGRILSNRGLQRHGKKITYSNCYVITSPDDSIESIYECASKLARTFSYGGGCGVDVSNLAPRGAKINNAAEETTGAVSFMDLYSLTTELIGQEGRRGALMMSIACSHPDLEEFIEIKSDLEKVNKANLSIRVSDEFINAIKNNEEYTLTFSRKETGEVVSKTVMAKDVFGKFAEMNWDYAEPAFLYWDRIKNWNLLSNNEDFEFAGVNPCGEEPLPAGGSCLLGSINLSEFVECPFTDDAFFDYVSFGKAVDICVRALNDVLDEGLPLHPLQEQRDSVRDWRQIGLGIMGLADMLIKMGIKYGSDSSIELCSKIGRQMINKAIESSAILASEISPYPKCNTQSILETDFFKTNTFQDTKTLVSENGLRNSQLLTVAPTGSTSTMLGVSGGIEPIFANYYERKTESLHGEDIYYKVYTPIVKEYMEMHEISDTKELPEFFITSQEIPYKRRVDMQAVWQSCIDASISSTVNLPNKATVEDIENLYLYAWRKGLKGITVYRDGCKRTGILTTGKSNEKDKSVVDFPRGMIESVPRNSLRYRTYKLKTGCGNLYLFVGIDEGDEKIYDIFTNTDGVGGCICNTQAVSRLISACMRGGVPIEYIIKQLNKSGTCPSYQYKRGKGEELSNGKSCASAIANVLSRTLNEFKDHNDNESTDELESKKVKEHLTTSGNNCPECGGKLRMEGGCGVCLGDETHSGCGYSRCD